MTYKVRSLIRRGYDHQTYCEDSNFHYENRNIVVIAALDGCSSGYRSQFASELIAKLLRKACNDIFEDIIEPEIKHDIFLIKKIIARTHHYLQVFSNFFKVKDLELLSTIVMAVIDINFQNGYAAFIGDGCISINGELIENEQNNTPDYMAYHLEKNKIDDSELYATSSHIKYLVLNNIVDISVSTDGIDTFNKIKDSDINPRDLLFNSLRFDKLDVMLERTYNVLKLKGFLHFDDISIVRLFFDKPEITKNESL